LVVALENELAAEHAQLFRRQLNYSNTVQGLV